MLELIKGLDIGGAEMLLVQRLALSDRSHFDYRVGFLESQRTALAGGLPDDVAVTCFDAKSNADWAWVRRLRRYLVKERISVVNVHSPLMSSGVRLAVRSIPMKSRPVLVTTEHSVKHHWATENLSLLTVRLDDVVIAVSEPVGQARIATRARRRQTIEHGVDVASLRRYRDDRQAISRGYELTEDHKKIVSVANFRPEKGHARLLDAAEELHRERQDFCFYIAGHGPLETWARGEVAARGMQRYYKILGLVPQAARLIACADIFVLASDWEGRPVSLMEAMAAGVPSIASAVGGVPDMIEAGMNGVLFDPSSPRELTNAIRTLLDDPAGATRLGLAAADSSNSFDIRLASQKIEEVYVSLLGAR